MSASYHISPNNDRKREELLIRVADKLIDNQVRRNETIQKRWTSGWGMKTIDITTQDGVYTLGVTDAEGVVSLILSVDGGKGQEQNVHTLLGE